MTRPNLQDPTEALAYLRDSLPAMRPPANCDVAFMMQFLGAFRTVSDTCETLIAQVHEFKNRIMELEGAKRESGLD